MDSLHSCNESGGGPSADREDQSGNRTAPWIVKDPMIHSADIVPKCLNNLKPGYVLFFYYSPHTLF